MSNIYDNVSGLTPTYPSQNIAWPIPKSIFKVPATISKALPVAMWMCAEVMHGKCVSPIDHTLWGEGNSTLNKHLPSIHMHPNIYHPSIHPSICIQTSTIHLSIHMHPNIYHQYACNIPSTTTSTTSFQSYDTYLLMILLTYTPSTTTSTTFSSIIWYDLLMIKNMSTYVCDATMQ